MYQVFILQLGHLPFFLLFFLHFYGKLFLRQSLFFPVNSIMGTYLGRTDSTTSWKLAIDVPGFFLLQKKLSARTRYRVMNNNFVL